MRVFIITQDEPFFFSEALAYLLRTLPAGVEVVGAYVLEASPFGKRKTFLKKGIETCRVFGPRFLACYSALLVRNRLFGERVSTVFTRYGVAAEVRSGSINSRQSLDHVASLVPDVIISLGANQIFRDELLSLPPKGCLNLHTAKLPKYRGLMPLFWAMSNDEPEVGISVFLMDKGIDSGPILRQATFPLADFSMHELIRITKILGMRLVNAALQDLRDGETVLMPNDDNAASVVHFPERRDVERFLRHGKTFF